jgi:two-component system cell cycle response regulator
MVMAVTDSLTGLHNRNYLETHLENLVSRVRGEGKPVTILFLDIDYFKAINDTHGYLVGDKVLAELGRRIANNVRGLGLASRYGGEEFVVTMPDTDLGVATSVAERLRATIADEPFAVASESETIPVTVSIGVAATDRVPENGKGLIGRADRALLEAKRSGRNRVVTAAAPS